MFDDYLDKEPIEFYYRKTGYTLKRFEVKQSTYKVYIGSDSFDAFENLNDTDEEILGEILLDRKLGDSMYYYDWMDYSQMFSLKLSDLLKFIDFMGDFDVMDPDEYIDDIKKDTIYNPQDFFRNPAVHHIYAYKLTTGDKPLEMEFIGDYWGDGEDWKVWVPSNIASVVYPRIEDISVGSRWSFVPWNRLQELPDIYF